MIDIKIRFLIRSYKFDVGTQTSEYILYMVMSLWRDIEFVSADERSEFNHIDHIEKINEKCRSDFKYQMNNDVTEHNYSFAIFGFVNFWFSTN